VLTDAISGNVVGSVGEFSNLRQLLVGLPLITPNTYVRPNVSVDDWRKRSGVVSGEDFHEKNRQC